MAVSKRNRTIGLVAFAIVLVLSMVFAVGLFMERRESPDYRPGDVRPPPSFSAVPNPSPTEWPSDWPTPAPTEPDIEPGDGSFRFLGTVTRTDPMAVAEAFAELTVSWDTVTDDGTQAGLDRAMELVAEDASFETGGNGVGAGWLNASEHRAYTVPSVEFTPEAFHVEEGTELVFPPTGEPVTPVVAEASYKWQGRDGWVSSTSASRTVFMSLVERDGEWVVVEYGYVDPPADELAK